MFDDILLYFFRASDEENENDFVYSPHYVAHSWKMPRNIKKLTFLYIFFVDSLLLPFFGFSFANPLFL